MTEKWEQWKPISGLANRYYIESISEGINGFQIILSEEDNPAKKALFTFENSVDSYRSTNESFVLKIIDDLDKRYGTDFYAHWSFFKILNSDYLKWLSEKSFGISDSLHFKHLVFFGLDSMLDVITCYEPKIELIERRT